MSEHVAGDDVGPILVTGGSGFIGTNLVRHLADRGRDVVNVDIAAPRDPAAPAEWVRCDIRDAAAVRDVFAAIDPTVVVHLAARIDLDGRTPADYAANVAGVTNVVAAVNDGARTRRLVHASSQLVCTPGHRPVDEHDVSPPNAYGTSKVEGERIVRAAVRPGIAWTIVRPTTIWGPWFGPIYSQFVRTVMGGRYVHPKGVTVHKSFGYVGNTVHQLERLVDAPADAVAGRTMYLSDLEPYDILEWAREIATASGAREVREVPLPLLRIAARAGDVLARLRVPRVPLTSYRLRNILTDTTFDLEPIRALSGPQPCTRAEGTAVTVAWLQRAAASR